MADAPSDRAQMLTAIRRGLRRGPLPADQAAMLRRRLSEHPRQLIPARTALPREGIVALFVRQVEAVFGTVAHAASLADVPGLVAEFLSSQNLQADIVVAPHAELRNIPWSDRPLLTVREGRASPTDGTSVQHGFAGIAETGTLMLPAAPDRPTTLNLLPDNAIVVLRASRVVGPYEDAWDLLRAQWGEGVMPRNVMLVTGPSRSADIEQALELGAHGPRRLHVVLIDDDAAAQPA
jgi:L-lactate dehydrogenase complex protein LldG